MFEYCQRFQIDDLIPTMLIYASKIRTKITQYRWFYKNNYTVKVGKIKTEFRFLH